MQMVEMDEEGRILGVMECDDKYLSCNVCGYRSEDGKSLANDNEMHELTFGRNNRSAMIRICSRCLNDFAEKLWEYM